MAHEMHNPETGETVKVPGIRIKDHILAGYELVDGEVPVGNTPEEDIKSDGSSDEPTKDELYEQAQELDIEGRSTMNKEELAEAVEAETGEAQDEDGEMIVDSGENSDAQVAAHLGEPGPDVQSAERGTVI